MAEVDPRVQDTQDEATEKLINEEYKYVLVEESGGGGVLPACRGVDGWWVW